MTTAKEAIVFLSSFQCRHCLTQLHFTYSHQTLNCDCGQIYTVSFCGRQVDMGTHPSPYQAHRLQIPHKVYRLPVFGKGLEPWRRVR